MSDPPATRAVPPEGPAPGASVDAPLVDAPLAAVLAALEADGWRGRFAALAGGEVRCLSCSAELAVAELPLDGRQWLHGSPDPADAVLVVSATCARCDGRGVLVTRVGPDESPEDTDVVAALGDRDPGGRAGPDGMAI